MSQEQAIEAARARIQRLVEEIAALSKKDLPTEKFLPEFLNRVVKACDGRGGAVWLVGQRTAEGKAEFQLAAGVELESSQFQADEVQRALILRALTESVNQRQPVVLQPMAQQQPGSLETPGQAPQNRTPFPFLHIPLPLKEQILGVLQVWMQPYVTPDNYREFAQFLTQLTSYVETHFQSRRLGTIVLENQRLQHLLKFTSDLAGSLDPLEVSRLAANYGRDLIGCERCSVLWLDGHTWRVLSISGQEVVERKSTMVKAMAAFVGAHSKPEFVVLSKERLLAEHAANGGEDTSGENASAKRVPTDDIDLAYFDVSHVVSAAIAPLLDDEKQLVGAYFAESTSEGFFDAAAGRDLPVASKVTEWLATHAGKQLRSAKDYESLPFLAVTRRMRAARLAFTGTKRKRNIARLVIWGTIAAAILLCPWPYRIEGNCTLLPEHHSVAVLEIPGRVERIYVREGSKIGKGEPIADMDKRKLETELEAARKEVLRLEAEAERFRGAGVEGAEASAQVASLQAAAARANAKRIEADIEAATLRSPIEGVVLTKDVEKHAGETFQAGTPFAEVAAMDVWNLRIDVDQRDIGKVGRRLSFGPINVSYILYSQTAYTLGTKLTDPSQISAAAEARENEHVFMVTVRNVEIPETIHGALRPGLTGRARIELGTRPLGWILGGKLWNWLQIKMINWF
jgi:biotin carboxyl carrier protein